MTDMTNHELLSETQSRSVWQAMRKGAALRCPSCGEKTMFDGYLKVADSCSSCGQELHHHRADDAPPYLTIFVVGHIIVPLMLLVEKLYHPEMWVHWAIWPVLSIVMAGAMLPVLKGAFVGLQWALRMHGFAQDED